MRRIIAFLIALSAIVPALAQAPPSVPALPDTERRTQYSITSSTGPLSVGFAIYGDDGDPQNWIQVYVNSVLLPSAGNWTLTSNTGSISSIARPIVDGQITFTVAQTGTVQIVGARRPRRPSQFAENRGVAARDLNQEVTDLTAMERERWDQGNRAIQVLPGENPPALPPAASRAGGFLGFDSNGNPIVSPTAAPVSPGSLLAIPPGNSYCNPANASAAPVACPYIGSAVMSPSLANYTTTSTSTTAWNLIDPFGRTIACTSTTTQCLQEFMNATAANGWPAEVHCQGTQFPSHLEPIYINATSSVNVPVAQDWWFHADATCNLNFVVTSVPGLIFDSEGASVFAWDGKVVYTVSSPSNNVSSSPSCVALLQPHTNTADGFPGIYAGLLRIKSLIPVPVSGTVAGVVCVSTNLGSIVEQRLDFTEVNANNAASYGIVVYGASASTALVESQINTNQIHGAIVAAVDQGFGATNQTLYQGNQWAVGNIQNNGATSRGIDTFGNGDTFDVGEINNAQGGLQYCLVTETGAVNNNFRLGVCLNASTATLLDAGSGTTLINTGVMGATRFQLKAQATSNLPPCTSAIEGQTASVTDATSNTWGAGVAGSGTNHVLAYCDGSGWTVAGK